MHRDAQYLIQGKSGDMVAIGSVVGRNISPFSSCYGSSKCAVGALTGALRREVCLHDVRVSLVMPGIVVTEFQQLAGYDEENFDSAVGEFGKLLEPQAIAEGIHWQLTWQPQGQGQRNHDPPHGSELPLAARVPTGSTSNIMKMRVVLSYRCGR
jgi:NADP-dependent 3-hydroxy acid dehydrogenase YdfG